MTKHEFYTLARAHGQKRFRRETFDEFENRVLVLQAKRTNRPEAWRTENAGVVGLK